MSETQILACIYYLDGIFTESEDRPAGKLQRVIESAERHQVKATEFPDITSLAADSTAQQAAGRNLDGAGMHFLICGAAA